MEKDTVRIGKVSAVDYEKGLVRVAYHDRDDNVNAPMPMLSDKYFMPEAGDQVLVLHLSNGAEAGLVLGRYFTDRNVPREKGKGVFYMALNRDGSAFIKCVDGVVTIKSGTIAIDGNLTVSGDLEVSGRITAASVSASGGVAAGRVSLQTHTHTESAGGSTSAPT